MGKAGAAIRRFIWQHPQMISQKAALIIEHFRAHTAHALCAMFAVVVVAINVSAQMQRADWRGAADAIDASAPGAQVFVVPRSGDDPLAYYLGAEVVHHGGPSHVRTDVIPVLSTNFKVRRPPGPFHLADEQGLAPYFVLWRFEAMHAVRVRLEIFGRRLRPGDGLDRA